MSTKIKDYVRHLRVRAGHKKNFETASDYLRVRGRKKENGRKIIRLLGDHSNLHSGCIAVVSALEDVIRERGARPATFFEAYDAIVVNGEGSMHHSREHFHKKMGILRLAIESGLPAYLVNTVWQDNCNDYDDVLNRLSGVVVREVLSQKNLKERHGVESSVSIDASFFCHIAKQQTRPQRNGLAITDFRCPIRDEFYPDFWMFPKADYVSLKHNSWSEMIGKLSSYEYVVTGQHHAMYAACKARTPFVVSEGNSHKIRGLLETAQVDIPIASNPEQFISMLANIERYRPEYEKLFNWMEVQERGRLLEL